MKKLIGLLKIEWMKTKRSTMLPILLIAPVLVVATGIMSISRYFTPEYTNPWGAMFIQSALVYSYYLLPLTMIVVCVMLSARETQHNGIIKMLALPINRKELCIAKFGVLIGYLLIEIIIFFMAFTITGFFAIHNMELEMTIPIGYILQWSVILFVSMLPALATMWMFTVMFEKMLFTVGLNLVLVIPGVLINMTPLHYVYPYSMSGYFATQALHNFSIQESVSSGLSVGPMLLGGMLIFIMMLGLSAKFFGRKEMK